MNLKRIFLGVLSLALLLPSLGYARSSKVNHSRPAVARHNPSVPPASSALIGWSSWYGPEMRIKSLSSKRGYVYHRMANGQYFDPTKLTAASRTLPLGTIIRVWNLQTGQSVQVEITDRGPFAHGRILDLAEAAAVRIGCRGLCPVFLDIATIPLQTTETPNLTVPEIESEAR